MKYLLGLLIVFMLQACGEAPSEKQTIDLGKTPEPNEIADVPAVQNLQILNTGQNFITLRWSDEYHAHGYRIRRNGESISTLAKGLFTYNDTGLEINKEYQYDVVAFDRNGRESEPLTLNATTLLNNAPVITSEVHQLTIFDTDIVGKVISQIDASDSDGNALNFTLKSANGNVDLAPYFTINDSGEIKISSSLAAISGKAFSLQVEVSDGFSISSIGFQLGIIATKARVDHQGLSRNVYNHDSINSDVAELKNLAAYPASPTSSSIEPIFQSPSNVGDHYGQRMLGYLVPPTSGEYQFWIAADDSAELSLSRDHVAENLQVIARAPGWTNPLDWNSNAAQASETILLEAGKAYAIQALMVENRGGDHLAVAWQGPGIDQAIIANEYLRLPVDFEAPSAVQNVTWIKTSEKTVTLQWQAAQDNLAVNHYEIYNGGELLDTTEALTVELDNLVSATRYDISIRAVDNAGNRSVSSSMFAIIIDDFIAPTLVSGLSATDILHDSLTLNWNAASDEQDKPILYRIYQQEVMIAQTYATSLRIAALMANTEYQINIEALDEAGNSAGLSAPLTIKTTALADATPVFSFPQYEFIIPANRVASAEAPSHFGQLMYSLQGEYTGADTVQMSIVAGNEANYFALSNSGNLSLIAPFQAASDQRFVLTVAIQLEDKFTQAEVIVYAVSDQNFTTHGAFQQVWSGLPGGNITDINTQRAVSSQQVLTDFKSPTAMGDRYAQKVSAYLMVPEDGLYDFWIASDDASELRISQDISADKTELVARVNGYTGEDNWSNGSRIKTQIALKAGQFYYLEVLHKEGTGGDHMSVAWQGPNLAKGLLTSQYLYPTSNFVPANIKMDNAFQTNFAQLGNQIQLELLVNELNAGYPLVIYYGEMDAGKSATGWQHQITLTGLTAGQHQILLDNINAGSRYYIRIETQGPLSTQNHSSWSDHMLVVDTVVIDESKTVGEALPQTLSLTVNVDGEDLLIELEKHSVRSPNYQLLTFDNRRVQQFESVAPMPEVRTYRGHITNNLFRVVTGVVDSNGTIYLSAWGGDRHHWGRNIDISAQINPDALGNSESSTTELKTDFSIPEIVDNRLYLPKPGRDFHNNLARVSFLHEHTQFKNEAGGSIINAIAQMEGHINELDYVWAQKTGLRWDIGRALIEVNGSAGEASQSRPVAKDDANFSMDFQDPVNGGHCWGGGDWLGCVANYTMNWGFTHEVGHNFGLGHGEQTDSNFQIQQPSTQMGNMQAWKTTQRLQRGTKFKPAEALTNPMLPATFKDYLTVYQNESGAINPLDNDYDANGDVLNIESFEATTLQGGRVVENPNGSGSLIYTPATDFIGVDQFSYVASDTQGYKTKGPVQIQVLGSVLTANGLVAHWDMDTVNANVITDLSGRGNDLTAPDLSRITSTVTAEASLADVQVLGPNNQSNQALSIPLMASNTKADDAIGHSLLPHNLDPGHKSFTAAMWFKYTNIGGNKLLIGKSSSGPNNMQYGGWEIRSEANDAGNWLKMQVNYRDRLMRNNQVVISQEAALNDGVWHHVAMVIDRDSNELRGYLDGVALTNKGTLPLGNGPIMAAMNSSGYGGGSPFRVGGHASVACVEGANEGDAEVCSVTEGQAFDNVKLFNKALTEAEIVALFNE